MIDPPVKFSDHYLLPFRSILDLKTLPTKTLISPTFPTTPCTTAGFNHSFFCRVQVKCSSRVMPIDRYAASITGGCREAIPLGKAQKI